MNLRRLFGFAGGVAPEAPAPIPVSVLSLPAAAAAAAAAAAGLALTRLNAARVVATAAATFCSHGLWLNVEADRAAKLIGYVQIERRITLG